jgi:hypothetical protein
MTSDETIPQISQAAAGQNLAQAAAAAVPAGRGPDGKFLAGNQAAADHYFKAGVSGNPAGRPSTRRFTAKLREALDKNDGEMLKAMVNVACQRALRGDFRYFKEIIDRVEGKVPDRIAVETELTARTYTDVERSESRRLAMLLIASQTRPAESAGEAALPDSNDSL